MTKELSVFIDESGDFGEYSEHSPFYLVTFVLHDQNIDIQDSISALEWHVINLGYRKHAIHTGPLIRRESIYSYESREKRRKLFNALFHFARRATFNYICLCVEKKECPDRISLVQKLSLEMAASIKSNIDYFESYDHVIVYYDNGQVELTKIITSVFSSVLNSVEFRKIRTSEYNLAQIADLICTVELTARKMKTGFTESEIEFFGTKERFKKNILKYIRRKKL